MKGPQMLGTRPFHKDYMTLPNVIGQILMSLDWICLFLDQLGWGSVYEPSNSHCFCYLRSSPTSPTSICPVLQLVTQRNGDGITFRRLAAVNRAGVLPWDLAQGPQTSKTAGAMRPCICWASLQNPRQIDFNLICTRPMCETQRKNRSCLKIPKWFCHKIEYPKSQSFFILISRPAMGIWAFPTIDKTNFSPMARRSHLFQPPIPLRPVRAVLLTLAEGG